MTARGIPNTFMMEGTRCEQIETSSEIKSEIKTEPITEINSILYEKDGKLAELDSELQENFCAVMKKIKYEKTEVVPEFETVYVESATLSETCQIPRSEQSLEFSRMISKFTDYTPLMSLCRLCATQSNSMIYMFSQNELHDTIIEKIEYCLPIEVKKSDTLPKEICHLCLEKLELCYQFHKTVEAAEKQLLTFNDGHCNNEKYTFFSNRDVHSNIIEPLAILQELPKRDTGTRENSTILSNSMLQNEMYCAYKPNEESRMENASDKDQCTCNSLLTCPVHVWNNTEEKLNLITPESYVPRNINRHRDSDSLKEEVRDDESYDDFVVCEDVFNKRTSAGKNIIGHELIRCQNCRETFETVNQCFAHSSIHASQGYYPCCLCGAIFQTKEDGNKHRLEHKEGENMTRGRLQTNNKSITKPLGEAKLEAKMELNSNISSKNELHCKKCNEDIDSETSLDERLQHMLTVHKQQKKSSHNVYERTLEHPTAPQSTRDFSFECKLCNSRFQLNYNLEVHKKTDCSRPLQSTEKQYLCTYCKQRFRHKGRLKIHLRIHTGERPYGCDVCGKMFRIKDIRDSHRRTHTGERPFKCSKCEKRFTSSSARASHSLVHSDAKPYSCHLCPLSFKRFRARDVHLRLHTGERPYKCDICGVSYTQNRHLRRHKKSPCLQTLPDESQN